MLKKKKALLLARFVVSHDKKIGESISFYKDLLIIRKGGKYYAIPMKYIELKNDMLHLKGIIHWEKAEELAKEWKNAQNGNSNK